MPSRQKRKTAFPTAIQQGACMIQTFVAGIDFYAVLNSIDGTFTVVTVPFSTGQVQKHLAIIDLTAGSIPTQ